jgi:hypothetical protein
MESRNRLGTRPVRLSAEPKIIGLDGMKLKRWPRPKCRKYNSPNWRDVAYDAILELPAFGFGIIVSTLEYFRGLPGRFIFVCASNCSIATSA